jgi:hypothetical protein
MQVLRFFLSGGLFTLLLGSAAAQPDRQLEVAIERLEAAGNYGWEAKHEIGGSNRPGHSPVMARRSGETQINGFTDATVQGCHVLIRERQMAYDIKGRWRLAEELTAEELESLGFLIPAGRGQVPVHLRIRPLAHEILPLLRQHGINIRKDGAAILGDFDDAIDSNLLAAHLRDGAPLYNAAAPALPQRRGILGLPVPGGSSRVPRPPTRPLPNRPQAAFIVWLAGEDITEFAIEVISPRGQATSDAVEYSSEKLTVKLLGIGRTRVEVDLAAKRLFPPSLTP